MQEYFDYSGFEEIAPEVIEKKRIRRLGLACGLGLFALFTVMCFWGTVYFRITAILGIPDTQALNFANHPYFSQLFHIVLSAVMIVLPFFIVAKASGFKMLNGISFKAAKKGEFLPSVMLGLGVCLFSSFATNYGSWIFSYFGIEFPSGEQELPVGFFGILAVIIATAVFPALLEELVMRGMVMGMLRKNGDTFAIICSAFVFGIMHADANQIVFAFFVGLILGFITVKSESIWPAVTVHFLNNFISVVFSYLDSVDGMISSVLLIAIFAATVLLAIYSLIKLQQAKEGYLKLNDEGTVSQARKITWFLTSPAIIIGTVISLLIAFFMR